MGQKSFKDTLDDPEQTKLVAVIGEHRDGLRSALEAGDSAQLREKIAAMGTEKTAHLARFLQQFINCKGEYVEESWDAAE